MEWSIYSLIKKWASTCLGLGTAAGFEDARMNKKDKNLAVMEFTDIQTNPTECVRCYIKGRGRFYGSTQENL